MGVVSQLVAFCHKAFWYGNWIIISIARPLILSTLFCIAFNPRAAQVKIKLLVNTFRFLILSKDKNWKTSDENPASFFSKDDEGEYVVIRKKTVIFLRHGESTWNETFNRGHRKMLSFLIGFLPGIFLSLANEWYFLVRGQSDESWFFDSPLSSTGIAQAEGVAKFLRDTDPKYSTPKEANLLRLIKGEEANTSTNTDIGESGTNRCVLVSSNLRRAISTCAIALKDRLDRQIPRDKIIILQELQEASINPDAQSISPPFDKLVTSFTDSDRVKDIYAGKTDTSLNKGNKKLESNGMKRMQAFCDLLFFDEKKESISGNLLGDANHVLCTGHSYWFRAFFQTYLPSDFQHVCKTKKLINGGMVGFTVCHTKMKTGEDRYMIDPNSLVVLYGGF